MPDLKAIGTNLAGRYAPGQVATPAGGDAIASSSAQPPKVIGQTPAILVLVDQGSFGEGGANGTRLGTIDWRVCLYYHQADASAWELDAGIIEDYLTTMFDQHLIDLDLGGKVVTTRTLGFRLGLLTYAGKTFSGGELRVRTITTEPWAPAA